MKYKYSCVFLDEKNKLIWSEYNVCNNKIKELKQSGIKILSKKEINV